MEYRKFSYNEAQDENLSDVPEIPMKVDPLQTWYKHNVRWGELDVLSYLFPGGDKDDKKNIKQGIVDGSTSKPALRQDTGYMVEKTYHIAPYLGAFGAYLMPQ